MATAYVGVGSNIEPEANIPLALKMLSEKVRVTGVSTFYLSQALGAREDPGFYNGAVRIETDFAPRELKFDILRKIEDELGRIRTGDRYSPRTIDLDVVLYDNVVVREPGLVLPDPDVVTRVFLAAPLLELDPDLILPGGLRLADIAGSLATDTMTPLRQFSERLKLELANEPGSSPTTC